MKCKLPSIRAVLIALVCYLQILPFYAAAQENFSEVKGLVHGDNNQPLIGASVLIRNSKTNFTTGTKTDSSGVFAARVPAGGPYSFALSIVGYDPQTLSGYNLKGGTTFTLDVLLLI